MQHCFDLQPLQVWGKGEIMGLRLSVPTAHCPYCPVDPANVAAIELDYPCPHLTGSDLT